MKRAEAIEILKGKTIKDMEHGEYMGWFTVGSITFTDGTVLELAGNCDYANIEFVTMPDGNCLSIEDE